MLKLSAKMIATVLALPTDRHQAKSLTQIKLPGYCSVSQNLITLHRGGYVFKDREGMYMVYSLTSLGKELKTAIIMYFYDKEFALLYNTVKGVKEHTILTLISLGFNNSDLLEKYCLKFNLDSSYTEILAILTTLNNKGLLEAYNVQKSRLTPQTQTLFLTEKGKAELQIVEDFIVSHNPSKVTTRTLSQKPPSKLLCGRE